MNRQKPVSRRSKGRRTVDNVLDLRTKKYLDQELRSFVSRLPDTDPLVCSLGRAKARSLRKYVPHDLDKSHEDRLTREALDRFLSDEERNKETNDRVRKFWRLGDDHCYADPELRRKVQSTIRYILGDSPDVSSFLRLCRFGPGASVGHKRPHVDASFKFSSPEVTWEFNSFSHNFIMAASETWAHFLTDEIHTSPLVNVVPGNRFSTVLKDQGARRTILVEPTLNSFAQQGGGRLIRANLKRVGLDLTDQTLNQRLAELASRVKDIATLDLKSASNLMAKLIVEDNLPPAWFTLLDVTRSHRTKIGDRYHELEMFSSMGNGFTFDLETLLFYAITYARCTIEGYNPFWISVYGDDIICPSGIVEKLEKDLSDYGFLLNKEKSYAEGSFRESCGKDYNNGSLITPFYVKSLQTLENVWTVHNSLREWCRRVGYPERNPLLLGLKQVAISKGVPLVPSGIGGGLHCEFDELCPPLDAFGRELYRFSILTPAKTVVRREDRWMLLRNLAAIGSEKESDANEITLPVDTAVFRVVTSYFPWMEIQGGTVQYR